MKFYFYIIIISISTQYAMAQNELTTPYEYNKNQTASYSEIIAFYNQLARENKHISVNEFGITDVGEPLREIIIDKNGSSDVDQIKNTGKAILFINNGIHPGEPCGIDATMMFARDIKDNSEVWEAMNDISIVIIPVYNIGGAMNRGSYSRANQNGPESYGFRGNAKNYDLNRDFIKCDSRNAQSFNQLFNKWEPEYFIDNHTSNGADYQHIMTLIATQEDKIAAPIGAFMRQQLLPELYQKMKESGYEMTPYVDMVGRTPDDGITGFVDYPRYSTGYAALHHAIGFMPETHMLKTFEERVQSTYQFMVHSALSLSKHKEEIQSNKKQAIEQYNSIQKAPIDWERTQDITQSISFLGYEAEYKPSEIHGGDRLYYNRKKPYRKDIPFYNTVVSTSTIDVPESYIVPQTYGDIIDRLKWNKVKMEQLQVDTTLEVEVYRITDFNTANSPYEGHYLHSDVKVEKSIQKIKYRAGDYIISLDQKAARYIIETLEPQAPDSYFNWNFMDGILQMKEHFSPYVFEDLAVEILNNNPEIKAGLEKRKKQDKDFSENGFEQLKYIYINSQYYEPTHRRYPVARLIK